jgi:hypothetical protein
MPGRNSSPIQDADRPRSVVKAKHIGTKTQSQKHVAEKETKLLTPSLPTGCALVPPPRIAHCLRGNPFSCLLVLKVLDEVQGVAQF